MTKTADNDQNLKQVLSDIEKQFGKGSIMKLGDNAKTEIDVIPSGSIALDIALGIGGYPKGRIIEIYGPESSGKTTFSHRLSIQLRANGLVPHPIAVDNYFVERDQTPKDANGKFDFECLETVDYALSNPRNNRRIRCFPRQQLTLYLTHFGF